MICAVYVLTILLTLQCNGHNFNFKTLFNFFFYTQILLKDMRTKSYQSYLENISATIEMHKL